MSVAARRWSLVISESIVRLSSKTDLVFGIVSPIGSDRNQVDRMLTDALARYSYDCRRVRVSRIIENIASVEVSTSDEYARLDKLMLAGNKLRSDTGEDAILAMLSIASILQARSAGDDASDGQGRAFLVDSIKHPAEVMYLRQTYGSGFYLIALHVDRVRRRSYLVNQKNVDSKLADELILRDESDGDGHGQSTRDAFHLADFFIHYNGHEDKLRNSIQRMLRLIFGHPCTPPTFNEFAMYVAFASAMRSSDMSRQVGAVIARHKAVIATGANEAPKFGGGQYWAEYDPRRHDVLEAPNGRDFERGHEANHLAKAELLEELVAAVGGGDDTRRKLKETSLWSITEYGRSVHAEMEAILSCARSSASTHGADLYSTTFPCHNCAKHAIASGIRRVFYIEPYPKSRALKLHDDAISEERDDLDSKLVLRPFVGVGPRQFVNCFSMELASGRPLVRKSKSSSKSIEWNPSAATPRVSLLPMSYQVLEQETALMVNQCITKLRSAP